jgi:3-hydroxyacyl-[acyl-carrier-protein] dehydratase
MSEPGTLPPLLEIIPHRPPFLLLDEVLDRTEDRVIARRTLRPDEYFFQGHYPGRPIMPGVLMCEMALQAGAYLMGCRDRSNLVGIPVATRLNQVRLKRMVHPGDTLEVEVHHQSQLGARHDMRAVIRRDGKTVCTLEFAVSLVEEEAGP